MTNNAVAPAYLDRRVRVAKMARTLKGAPDALLSDWCSRLFAYDCACALPDDVTITEYVQLDNEAVNAERARRRAFGEV